MSDPYAGIGSPDQDPYQGIGVQASGQAGGQTNYENTAPYNQALGATYPVSAEIEQGIGNARIGVGKLYTDVGLRLHQLYNAITGGPSLDQDIEEKRARDQQISSTFGGKAGEVVGAAPLGVISGPSVAGGAALGGILGFLQPTTSHDYFGSLGASVINTAIGATSSAIGTKIGSYLANWAPVRAQYPFMGHTPASADAVLANSVGSDAPALTRDALGRRAAELGNIFRAGRSAATSIDLGGVESAANNISAGLGPEDAALFNQHASELLGHVTGPGNASGETLGNISTKLRQASSSMLNVEGGNRVVGRALGDLRESVEDAIQANITDPTLRAQYALARTQYGLLQDVRYNPTLLNASTGRANMEAIGKYLQRNNPAYTSDGAMDNPLFNAAVWGQRGGGAKGAPPLLKHFGLDRLGYAITHNPVAGAIGGAVSKVASPVATAIPYISGGLSYGTAPMLLPYLEE